MRVGSKVSWWASKCFWVAVATGGYWISSYLSIALFAIAVKASISLGNTELLAELLALGEDSLSAWEQSIVPMLLTVPVLSTSLSLVELSVGVCVSPIWGFCIVTSALFLSAFMPDSRLVGNYLMALRSSGMVAGGASATVGVSLGMAISVVAATAGAGIFKRADIVGRGGRENAD